MKAAIWEGGAGKTEGSSGHGESSSSKKGPEEDLDEEEIAKMEKMMRKLQAVREAGEGIPEEQRRRMAARAVEEVMKEL